MPKVPSGAIPWGTKNCSRCGDLLTQANAPPSAYTSRNYRCRACVHPRRNPAVAASIRVPVNSGTTGRVGGSLDPVLLEQLRLVSRHPDFKRMLADMQLEQELGEPADESPAEEQEEQKNE